MPNLPRRASFALAAALVAFPGDAAAEEPVHRAEEPVYREHSRGLLIGGLAAFGFPYVHTAGFMADERGGAYAFLPVVGPFLLAGGVGIDEERSALEKGVFVTAGLNQLVGSVMASIAVALPFEEEPEWGAGPPIRVTGAPGADLGIGLAVRF